MSQDYDDDKINWADISDSIEVLPGTYLLKIEEIELRSTRDGSKEFIPATFTVLDCLDASVERSIGSKVFDSFSLNPKALWKLKGFAKACDPDIVSGEASFDAVIAAMENQIIVADAVKETYQGQENMRLKRARGAEGWDGLHFRVERGQLIGESDDSNGKAKPAKPAKHTTKKASTEDEVEL